MNAKQRVKKTLKHEEPDCVPITDQLIVSNVASQILGKYAYTGGGEFERDTVEALIKGERDFIVTKYKEDILELYHEKLDLDIISVGLVPPKDSKKEDYKVEKIGDNTYLFKDKETGLFSINQFNSISGEFFTIDSSVRREGLNAIEKQVLALEKKLSEPVDFPDGSFEMIDFIVEKVGQEKAIVAQQGIGIPFETAWLEAIITQPKLVEILLDWQLYWSIAYIKEVAKYKIDFILGGGDLANNQGPLYSPAHFRKLVLPRFKKIISLCHKLELPYIFRTDGNTKLLWDELFIESGADGYAEIDAQAGMNVKDLRDKFGHKIVLFGNVDCAKTLVYGIKEEIFAEVKDCIQNAAHGGGFILASSNSIHYNVPAENLLYMIEAGKKYGKYPINRAD